MKFNITWINKYKFISDHLLILGCTLSFFMHAWFQLLGGLLLVIGVEIIWEKFIKQHKDPNNDIK